jgi:hypothetical protein
MHQYVQRDAGQGVKGIVRRNDGRLIDRCGLPVRAVHDRYKIFFAAR